VLAYARNLTHVHSGDRPRWVELREAFKKAGLRTQERQVTYAIKYEERLQAGPIEGVFHLLLFELPCQYGMSPERALKILSGGILLFAPLYYIALKYARERHGIWAIVPADRTPPGSRKGKAILVQPHPAKTSWDYLIHELRLLRTACYFSLLSAFSLGWRELNIGTWIIRMQPREYSLRATGWVRTVSGLQSLLSVYLLALWVLTYFGRPFE
jgi:hypothetical protein